MFSFLFSFGQVKLPFEKLIHALRNFPEDAMDPDTLLPMAYSIKVFLSCTVLIALCNCNLYSVVCYFYLFLLKHGSLCIDLLFLTLFYTVKSCLIIVCMWFDDH